MKTKDEESTDITVKLDERYFVNGKSVSKDKYEKLSEEFNKKMKETFENFSVWSLFTDRLLRNFW